MKVKDMGEGPVEVKGTGGGASEGEGYRRRGLSGGEGHRGRG